jgi:GntR family transcriptional regulator of vanillate catabolism
VAATLERDAERAASQTVKAQLALRDLVLGGALRPGERLSELSMVERLGVSRTPVRAALARLEQEGLLEALPSGGFAVKAFSEREAFAAIEIRGTLEGLAARLAVERGVTKPELAPLKARLAAIDPIVERDRLTVEDFSAYIELNARFHELLWDLAQSPALSRQIERAAALPFASPSALVPAQATSPQARTILTVAQDQHRCVVEAIERGEGTRAESLMREHARLASRNLALALASQHGLSLVPGSALITQGERA